MKNDESIARYELYKNKRSLGHIVLTLKNIDGVFNFEISRNDGLISVNQFKVNYYNLQYAFERGTVLDSSSLLRDSEVFKKLISDFFVNIFNQNPLYFPENEKNTC